MLTSVPIDEALQSIDPVDYVRHVKTLSSDEFAGRFPNTQGEKLTLDYLTKQFTEVGAVPAGVGGGWLQPVPFQEITSTIERSEFQNSDGSFSMSLRVPEQLVCTSKRVMPLVELVHSPCVFVGYGCIEPKHDWNDFKDINVKGKTVIVLINDPGLRSGDSSFFKGTSLTYHGRWTCKYELCSSLGAAAVLIVHDTEGASYGWSVVCSGKVGPHVNNVPEDETNASRVMAEGWITTETARALFAASGESFDALFLKAHTRQHRSFDLKSTFSITIRNTFKRYESSNFLAKVPGTARHNEAVIFTAHWDHFGVKDGKTQAGANDNASGVAALIELARAFKRLANPPSRTIVFISFTAEEQGLLGSYHYVRHPVVPLNLTAAVLNFDIFNIYGATKDVAFYGWGYSELDRIAEQVALESGRYISAEPKPTWGMFFRSDHWPFAQMHVATLFLAQGDDHVKHGKGFVSKQMDHWIATCYHKPEDKFDESWDIDGLLRDVRYMGKVGYRIAMASDVFKTLI